MPTPIESASQSSPQKLDTPLENLFELAVNENAYSATELLARYGVDPTKLSPLALAHLGLVKKDRALIEQAHAQGLPCDDIHPLHILAFACIKGVNSQLNDPTRHTPLHHLAKKGYLPHAMLLLEWGADVNSRDYLGYTPFLCACAKGHTEMALALLEHGANSLEKAPYGISTLHVACTSGHRELVAKLLDTHNFEIDLPNRTGVTPLHFACYKGHKDLALMLIKRGASLLKWNSSDHSALHCACHSGNLELVQELIDTFKCPVDAGLPHHRPPLLAACGKGKREIANFLIERGASLTDCDDLYRDTALHYASCSGNAELVAELIEKHHCPVDVTNRTKHTPLHFACKAGHREVVKTLLTHGASMYSLTSKGETPLQVACAAKHRSVMLEFIKNGVQPSQDASFLQQLHETLLEEPASLGATLRALPPDLCKPWLHFRLSYMGQKIQPLLNLASSAFWDSFTQNNEGQAAIFKLYQKSPKGLTFPLWLGSEWKHLVQNAAEGVHVARLEELHETLCCFEDPAMPLHVLRTQLRTHKIAISSLIPALGTRLLDSLLRINTVYYTSISPEEVSLSITPEQPLDKLQEYGEAIDINDASSPSYIPLRRRTHNQQEVSKEQLILNVSTQLNHLKANTFYTGAPADEKARKNFYQNIELQLRAAIDAIEKEPNAALLAQKRAKCALVLGLAGFDCAAQLKSAARDLYFEFALSKTVTFKEALAQQIMLLSELVFREMLPDDNVHTFNRHLFTMKGLRPIPGMRFNDPHGPQSLHQLALLSDFDNRMEPQRLFAWIKDALMHNSDGIRDMYVEEAKQHISPQDIAWIDQQLEERLTRKMPAVTLPTLLTKGSLDATELKALKKISIEIGPTYDTAIAQWQKQQELLLDDERKKLTHVANLQEGKMQWRARTAPELRQSLRNAHLLIPRKSSQTCLTAWHQAKVKEIEAQATELRNILSSFTGKPERELLSALREAGMNHLKPSSLSQAVQESRERVYLEKVLYTPDNKLNEVKLLSYLHELGLFTANY